MSDGFKTMSAQEYSDLFSKLREQDDKFGTVGELNKVYAQKLAELLQMQENKFDTVSELHKVFAQKFSEYDTEIQSLKTRIAKLEGK